MRLPQIVQKADSVTMVNAFLGVNRNTTITDQEWSDMKNITTDYYPTIGNRRKKGIIRTLENPTAMLGGKGLAYVDNDKLYYEENLIAELEHIDRERQLVMMGAYLVVFPDGVIYNTFDQELDSIQNKVEKTGVTITLSKLDGTAFTSGNTVTSSSAPEDKSKYWIDTSTDDAVIKMYSASEGRWMSVGTTYVKFEAEGIGKGFKAYDAVRFSGVDSGDWIYNGYDFNYEKSSSQIVFDAADDYLVIAGFIKTGTHTNSKKITVERYVPDLEYVCEQGNRIWGCNSDKHEIYACKLGDPKNWEFYGGLDSDSYAATVGTQNIFTGCTSYGGYVFFFKEDGWHKLYGTKPSNFEMGWYPGRGVQQGSSKSIAVAGEYLYFKARDGICVYDGSATVISQKLGDEPFYDAVAGSYRDKYYVSMRDSDYRWRLYVYDSTKNTWCIEDDIIAKFFAYSNNGLYMVDYNNVLFNINNEAIYTAKFPSEDTYPSEENYPGYSISGELEETVEWMLETGDIGMNTPFQKYIKRILLRLWLDTSSKIRVEVMYDSSDEWINVMEYYATRKRSYEMPIPVQRCDHMRIRMTGWGDFKLYSIAKVVEEGSGR